MNQRGITINGFVFFSLFLIGLGAYFSGVYQALIDLNIGDPIFFQILGVGFLLLAILAIYRG